MCGQNWDGGLKINQRRAPFPLGGGNGLMNTLWPRQDRLFGRRSEGKQEEEDWVVGRLETGSGWEERDKRVQVLHRLECGQGQGEQIYSHLSSRLWQGVVNSFLSQYK